MDKNNAAQFIPLVQAMAEGKTIQKLHGSTWKDLDAFACWGDPESYRIKPEPRVYYAIQMGETVGTALYSPQERNSQDGYRAGRGMPALEWVKFVEEVQP